MQYKPRPGIVPAKICGLHVLIPTRAAYDHCKSIIRLPKLWAITYDMITKEEPEENMIRLHKILTKKPEEEIKRRIDHFCEELAKNGFLIKDSGEDEQ